MSQQPKSSQAWCSQCAGSPRAPGVLVPRTPWHRVPSGGHARYGHVTQCNSEVTGFLPPQGVALVTDQASVPTLSPVCHLTPCGLCRALTEFLLFLKFPYFHLPERPSNNSSKRPLLHCFIPKNARFHSQRNWGSPGSPMWAAEITCLGHHLPPPGSVSRRSGLEAAALTAARCPWPGSLCHCLHPALSPCSASGLCRPALAWEPCTPWLGPGTCLPGCLSARRPWRFA